MDMDKWTYETDINSEIWRGEICDTKEEAIKKARLEAIEYKRNNFKVGVIEDVTNFGVDVDRIIEDIQIAMIEEVGEVADDYLDDATTEHLLELEKQLNKVFYEWQEKYSYKPAFYKVISEEIMDVK